MWTLENLLNESDVEQKFVYPFLTEKYPFGLGLPHESVITKANIRKFEIDKGQSSKLYYPDYVIISDGHPIVVIEVKKPGEDIENAFREARLYSFELNSMYKDSSPVNFVLATDGLELWFGEPGIAAPSMTCECKNLNSYSREIEFLIERISWESIKKISTRILAETRPIDFFKPRRLLGGTGIQNEEIGHNTFGATITSSLSSIFNPVTKEERAFIALNAYIPSKRRDRYIDPIDRVIRAATPPSETHSNNIEDTGSPTEVVKVFERTKQLENKVLLIIGSVGSGKSTFIDYLFEKALPRDVVKDTVLCRLNMNTAPVSPNEIYTWLRKEIISGCKGNLGEIDFDELESIKKIYSVEINKFNKSVGTLYGRDSEIYKIKLAEHIQSLISDLEVSSHAYARYSCGDRGKLLVVVFDNCDKKTRDEQLLMFEAAQWLQKEFRCLVVLPLRDETYDNHRDQPPLDTALKDLVFRIEPPLFHQILIRRVQLGLKTLSTNSGGHLYFDLPNGMTVEYPRSDQAFYLTSIVKSLFEHDRFVRRMIVGLSGRNMRRALEIFLEFCNSGHIGEDQIFKIRQSEGTYTIPLHQVATVLLRMNRRFYESDSSYIKNVFSNTKDDPPVSIFSRYMILKWLQINFNMPGPSDLKGYFNKKIIKEQLIPYGISNEVIDREASYLLKSQCIIAEHLRTDYISDDDLLRLGPAGFVHIELSSNINYLAAVAEDTGFNDRETAERISNRIKRIDNHFAIDNIYYNAEELVNYIQSIKDRSQKSIGGFLRESKFDELTNIEEMRSELTRFEKGKSTDPWFNAHKRLPRESRHQTTVINETSFGIFVEFSDGIVGLVHNSHFNNNFANIGDLVEVEIIWVDSIQKKMNLKLIKIIQEDAGDSFL